jgi:hypothetical protein
MVWGAGFCFEQRTHPTNFLLPLPVHGEGGGGWGSKYLYPRKSDCVALTPGREAINPCASLQCPNFYVGEKHLAALPI